MKGKGKGDKDKGVRVGVHLSLAMVTLSSVYLATRAVWAAREAVRGSWGGGERRGEQLKWIRFEFLH